MRKMNIKERYQQLSEKNKIILVNVFGAFFIKGLSLIVSLLTTPAYIQFFNNEFVLGVWFTILSVLSWILNFDLGIGNGLRNLLAKAYAEKDYYESKKLVSSSYAVIGVTCFVIILVSVPFFNFVNWNTVFNIEKSIVSQTTMTKAVTIVFVGIVLQVFLKIISSVLYAVHKSSANNALSLATSVVLLVAMLVVPSRDNNQNLVFMALLYDIAVLLPYLIATVIFFCGKKYRKIAPSFVFVCGKHSKKVLSLGGYFFIVQILYMLIMSTNEYMITHLAQNSDVVEYREYFQMFTLGSTVFALALTPVWSAITKAIAEKDIDWVKKLYKKLLSLGLMGVCLELLMIPILQILFDIWLGDASVQVNYVNAIAFATLGGLMIFNSVFSNVANGAGKLRTQLWVFLCGAILKIPLSNLFVRMTESWIGVVIATDIVLFVYCVIQPMTLHKYIAHEMCVE